MNICCTKKLLDELDIKPVAVKVEEQLFSWHANVLYLHRRKAILLINDRTRFTILLFGIKAADLRKLNRIIPEAIRETFLAEGIRSEIVDKYIADAGDIAFTRTSSRSVLASLNQVAFVAEQLEKGKLDLEKLNQLDFNLHFGGWPFTIDGDFRFSRAVLIDELSDHGKEEIVSIQAVQCLVTLALEHSKVWRRVIMPLNGTFRKFHHTIQDSFGWQNYHQYEFEVLENGEKVALIESDIEEIDESLANVPILKDNRVVLGEYLPRYKTFSYLYDFGDGWYHTVIVEDYIGNYNLNYPRCIEGEGNCPPEDVGGELGYERFLSVINNPDRSMREDLLRWGQDNGYDDFKIEQVNFHLRDSFKHI